MSDSGERLELEWAKNGDLWNTISNMEEFFQVFSFWLTLDVNSWHKQKEGGPHSGTKWRLSGAKKNPKLYLHGPKSGMSKLFHNELFSFTLRNKDFYFVLNLRWGSYVCWEVSDLEPAHFIW